MSVTMNPVVDLLFVSNLRAVLLVVLAVGWLTVFRTTAGSLRHRVWLTVVAGCLTLPLISAVVPALSIPILPAEFPNVAGANVAGTVSDTQAAAATKAGLEPLRGFRLFIGIYVIGVVLLLGNFAVSVIRLTRFERSMFPCRNAELAELKDALCRELDIRRPVQLLVSDSAGSPFTWGAWRPRVVLPAAAGGWSAERMANVMRHELYHVRRFDWLRLCLQHLATSVYWFNPFVWLAARQCRFEAERACDDFVLDSGGRATDYAEQLVDLKAASRRPQISVIALGDGDFVRRIRAILSPANEEKKVSRFKTQIATIGIAASVVVLAACQVTNGQPAITGSAPVEPRIGDAARIVEEQRIVEEERIVDEQRIVAQARMRSEVAQREAELVSRRAEAASAANDGRTRALNEQLDQLGQLEVMMRALKEQQLALSQSREQLLRHERALQELSSSINRQADMIVQRERALAETQRALAELEVEEQVSN